MTSSDQRSSEDSGGDTCKETMGMNVLRGNGDNWQGDWGCISIKRLENQENDKTKTSKNIKVIQKRKNDLSLLHNSEHTLSQ